MKDHPDGTGAHDVPTIVAACGTEVEQPGVPACRERANPRAMSSLHDAIDRASQRGRRFEPPTIRSNRNSLARKINTSFRTAP